MRQRDEEGQFVESRGRTGSRDYDDRGRQRGSYGGRESSSSRSAQGQWRTSQEQYGRPRRGRSQGYQSGGRHQQNERGSSGGRGWSRASEERDYNQYDTPRGHSHRDYEEDESYESGSRDYSGGGRGSGNRRSASRGHQQRGEFGQYRGSGYGGRHEEGSDQEQGRGRSRGYDRGEREQYGQSSRGRQYGFQGEHNQYEEAPGHWGSSRGYEEQDEFGRANRGDYEDRHFDETEGRGSSGRRGSRERAGQYAGSYGEPAKEYEDEEWEE
jgi:hypothetical protein